MTPSCITNFSCMYNRKSIGTCGPADTANAPQKRSQEGKPQKPTSKRQKTMRDEDAVNDLSVTIVLPGGDLPPELFQELEVFLTEMTSAGLFGYEKGGVENNGHAQGIIR